MRKFGIDRLVAVMAMLLALGGSHNVLAASTHDARRTTTFSDTLATTDANATVLTEVKTETNKTYLIQMAVNARETAGASQGNGYGKVCYCVAVNINGTVSVLNTECEGFSGLTVGQDPNCGVDNKNIEVTVGGIAATNLSWTGDFTVHVNGAPNTCFALGHACTSNADCCAPDECGEGTCVAP